MRRLIRMWRLRVSLGGMLLLLFVNWLVVCWYHVSTSAAHGSVAKEDVATGDRMSSLRSRSQFRGAILSGSFQNGPLSSARRLEAAVTSGDKQAQSDRALSGSDGSNNEGEDDVQDSPELTVNDGDDDGEELEQYFHEERPSDYNASSVLSRAWVPTQVRTGAYTTQRWSAETVQAFNDFLSPTTTLEGCGNASECRNVTCHSAPVPRKLSSVNEYNASTPALHCKTLWVTGWLLQESCDQALLDYSIALATARYFAPDSIQPVVLLAVAKPGLPLGRVVRHLNRLGVMVIQLGQLSFHDFVADWHNRGNLSMEVEDLVQPYWALDLPRILAANGILNVNKVCPGHVLYTDPDVLFMSPVTAADMYELQSQLGAYKDAFLAYRPHVASGLTSSSRLPSPSVYFMDVTRFDAHWAEMLQFRQGSPSMSSVHDWLSAYFSQDDVHASYRRTLPFAWNWSPARDSALMNKYVKLAKYDSKISRQVADCSLSDSESKQAICCNDIRTAVHSMHLLATHLAPDIQTICPDGSTSAQDDKIYDDDDNSEMG